MFTGLIEDVGKIASLRLNKGSAVLAVETRLPLRPMELGASIAINGACLTVVKKGRRTFTVDVSPETLDRTSLAMPRNRQLGQSRTTVATPRPVRGPFGYRSRRRGCGSSKQSKQEATLSFLRFVSRASRRAFLVSKGSVAVDGISLTVNECSRLTVLSCDHPVHLGTH